MIFSKGIKVKSAGYTNILEESISGDEGKCTLEQVDGGSKVKLELGRFEIKTLCLVVE